MEYILITCEVSKLDKSNNFNDEQLENILLISLTWDVLKLIIYNEVNDEHPENI